MSNHAESKRSNERPSPHTKKSVEPQQGPKLKSKATEFLGPWITQDEDGDWWFLCERNDIA
jgi:hypothetical protein